MDFIFPGGKVDFVEAAQFPAIPAKVVELVALFPIKRSKNLSRKIPPEDSEKVTARIVAMRNIEYMSWSLIAGVIHEEFGYNLSQDGVRYRYIEAMKKLEAKQAVRQIGEAEQKVVPSEHPALAMAQEMRSQPPEFDKKISEPSDDSRKEEIKTPQNLPESDPTPAEIPTIRNCRIVRSSSDPGYDEAMRIIEATWQKGEDPQQVFCALAQAGLEVNPSYFKVMCMGVAKTRKAAAPQQEAPKIGNATLQEEKPGQSEKPPAQRKAISKGELETMIWGMYTKEHLTPDEISDKLCKDGYYYGVGTVRARLRAQGADL
jgi:hypothetical protein